MKNAAGKNELTIQNETVVSSDFETSRRTLAL